ncbi:hypothetical protein PPERSA_12004 [Pseudocohnilembus persalinus]|uniref:Uncharacterized protein n=1 Tax=Pseudocohnilembus persalinus TaxID=266149 RepID=A0A0V0QKS0_PSEPJ|nr:hypothetical protein PPERSA_12004 [Pseudocohnilembus persalinus]|eukprot:KRX02664.1 hypothetical protein PPERSA_12004 [Pseudocohnilembus persalinus]
MKKLKHFIIKDFQKNQKNLTQKNWNLVKQIRDQQPHQNTWKNDRQNLTKQNRLINSEFRSGVINVDNPYNENTKIYTSELQRIKDRQIKSQQIQKRHSKDLENQNKVNSTIEFFNSKSRISQPSNLDNIKINPLWNQKTRVQTSKQYKQWNESQTRLFGGPIEGKYSVKRAENIQKNDQRGRDYDFISFSKSHLNGFQKSHQNSEMTQKE